jgi:hypothetical protein
MFTPIWKAIIPVPKPGNKFTMETIKGTQLIQKFYADKIVWQPKKGKWTLQNYQVRTLDSLGEKLSSGMEIDTTINLSPKILKVIITFLKLSHCPS